MNKLFTLVFSVALFLAMPVKAIPQNTSSNSDILTSIFDSDGWLLGVSVIANSSPYLEAGNIEVTPLPYIAWDKGPLHIGIDGLSYELLGSNFFRVDAVLLPRWAFSAADDSELFRDLNRDDALDAGLNVELDVDDFYLSATALADVSDVYEGHSASMKAGARFMLGSVFFDVGGGYQYQDKKLNLHLYGVKPSESSSSLQSYAPKEGWQPFAEITFAYPFGKKMALIGSAQFIHLSKNVRSSPLIEDEATGNLSLTFVRRF